MSLTYLKAGRTLFLTGIISAISVFSSYPAQARGFLPWLEDFRREAVQYGISEALVAEALPDTLRPNERIIRLDNKQPEGGISFERYKKNVVTASRIKAGRNRMHQHKDLLGRVSSHYGVPAQYVVALWGIETNYGSNTGGFETIPALATLAYDARRSAYFRGELLKALRIVDQGHINLDEMIGSWAGAMGQCQFMPTSYEKYAQDFDGNGHADIWNSEADVFASAANYLAKEGWRAAEPWGVHISLSKNFDTSLIGIKVKKSPQFWREAGVHVPAHVFAEDDLLSVVQPGGHGYKTYLVGNNYRILMHWNTSTYFATAVGQLADAVKG